MKDTSLIMPYHVIARGWEGFASIDDVLRARGLRPGQLRFLYTGFTRQAGLACLTATFAVVRL